MSDFGHLQEQLDLINSKISTSDWDENGCHYYELLTRLHLLLVKNKIRKAYHDAVSLKKLEYFKVSPDIDSVIIDHLGSTGKMQLDSLRYLKQISLKMNLGIHEEKHSYFYLNKNDAVPSNVLDKFCKSRGYGRYVWIFNDPNEKNTIKDVVRGNIRVGDLLEYPKCCVDWFTEAQTNSLIDCYNLCLNTSGLILNDDGVVKFLIDYFETDSVPNNEKRILDIKKNHVKKTISQYPFVFHQACATCLKNFASPTARLNQRYGEFARLISQRFYQTLLDESKTMAAMC